jgi:tetratricopeptide (TPR) repeat protein
VKSVRTGLIFLTVCALFLETTLFAQDVVKAKELLQRGEAPGAIELLRKVIKKEKENIEAYIVLAEALTKVDSTDQALAVLFQAREVNSSSAQVYVGIADTYVKQNLYAAAVPQYEEAVKYDSSKAEIFEKLSEANMKLRKYTEAAKALQKAIVRDTSKTENYRKLGNLFYLAKQYKNAIPFLEKVVARDPSAIQEQTQLVKCYFSVGQYDDLIPFAEKLTQADSSKADIVKILALAYAKKKPAESEKAEKIFIQLALQDSLNADDYVEYGKVLKTLEKTDEAVAAFEKSFILDSTNGDIYYDLGALYMKQKRYQEAKDMFDRKIAEDTTTGYRFASSLNAGLCLMQLKDFQSARQYILKSVELRPDYIQGWASLANCYAQMDSIDQKIQTYQKVIELATAQNTNGNGGKFNPQLKEANQMIGVQYLLDKKYAPAITYLKNAIQLEPKDCNLSLWLAQAYHNMNTKEEAIKYYKKVIEVCAKNSQQREDAKKGLMLLGIVVD